MGILKSAADLVYTIRFLKLLVTKFEDTDAFKAGIIDKEGNRNKDFNTNTMDNRDAMRTHYTPFHRLVYNIKRLMSKIPGGGSKLASYAAALFLIKENGNLSDKNVLKIHNETGVDILDILSETTQWYMIEDNKLSPGIYKVKHAMMTTACDEIIDPWDKIRVLDDRNSPIGEVLGIDIYEGIHERSRQRVFFSTGDILR